MDNMAYLAQSANQNILLITVYNMCQCSDLPLDAKTDNLVT